LRLSACWRPAEPRRPEDVLVSLIDDLDLLAGSTVVALDDYHVIDSAAIHEAVTFLLDNLPPQVTLAMTTRADPPLPLSRLRARGELVEVRAAELRFTADEAEAFLNEVMGLELEPALVTALETRTEGWAAGLQLAALSADTCRGRRARQRRWVRRGLLWKPPVPGLEHHPAGDALLHEALHRCERSGLLSSTRARSTAGTT